MVSESSSAPAIRPLTQSNVGEPDKLVAEHNPYIVRAAARFLKDPDIAEDIAQNARVKLWRWAQARPGASCTRSMVHKSVKAAAVSEVRDRRKCMTAGSERVEPLQDHHADLLVVEAPDTDVLARRLVAGWLPTLPLRLRAVYCGLYVRNLTQREVARRMRCSQPRVAQLHEELLGRGRERFARIAAEA